MRVTDALRGEHAAMQPQLRYVREMTKPGRSMEPTVVKALSAALKQTIYAHSSLEDSLLYQRWKKIPVVRHALREHSEIHELLDQAAAEGDPAVLNHAVRLTLGHFAEEERDAFPVLEKQLSADELAALGLEWMRLRGFKV
jgi:hemerythrin-like domain-containing protein